MQTTRGVLFAVVLAVSTLGARAANHTIALYVHVSRGEVGAHFSEYKGPVFRPHFVKIKFRDDENHHPVRPGDPWDESGFTVGPGTYVFDLSDWRNNPEAEVYVAVDGQWAFRGHGSAPNYAQWNV